MNHSDNPLHIGFVSTRISGTDGVSLETEKWANVLVRQGHECFYFAGEIDRPPERSHVVAEASFDHPTISAINTIAFTEPWALREAIEPLEFHHPIIGNSDVPTTARHRLTTETVYELSQHLKKELYEFVNQYEIQLLIAENALAIPMNLPLGVALTEFIAETGIPTIAHHHDFYWERKRFLVNSVGDYLRMSFPPTLPSIHHVTISSWAAKQMALYTGASAVVIPNVMDFENPPPPPDEYCHDLRENLGLEPGEYLVLQPTRVVQRKGIEHAIELVKRMGLDARLVISHASGDEGDAYEKRVREFAELLGVKARFVANTIRPERGTTADGRKVYSLADVYQKADLVTYPSVIEGFGNAFLEAIYYRQPVVVNDYSIYAIEIRPKGFRAIEFDGFISDDTVQRARDILMHPERAAEMADLNYDLGRRFFSYCVLERRLNALITNCFGEEC